MQTNLPTKSFQVIKMYAECLHKSFNKKINMDNSTSAHDQVNQYSHLKSDVRWWNTSLSRNVYRDAIKAPWQRRTSLLGNTSQFLYKNTTVYAAFTRKLKVLVINVQSVNQKKKLSYGNQENWTKTWWSLIARTHARTAFCQWRKTIQTDFICGVFYTVCSYFRIRTSRLSIALGRLAYTHGYTNRTVSS